MVTRPTFKQVMENFKLNVPTVKEALTNEKMREVKNFKDVIAITG